MNWVLLVIFMLSALSSLFVIRLRADITMVSSGQIIPQ